VSFATHQIAQLSAPGREGGERFDSQRGEHAGNVAFVRRQPTRRRSCRFGDCAFAAQRGASSG
jgi:hypothetical protein